MDSFLQEISFSADKGWINSWTNSIAWGKDASGNTVEKNLNYFKNYKPQLVKNIKIREDGLIYDTKQMKMYKANSIMVKFLKSCNGNSVSSELVKKFGERKLELAQKFNLIN